MRLVDILVTIVTRQSTRLQHDGGTAAADRANETFGPPGAVRSSPYPKAVQAEPFGPALPEEVSGARRPNED
jgi:hypothetical protein